MKPNGQRNGDRGVGEARLASVGVDRPVRLHVL